jgi:homoserine kinase type II
MMQDDKKQHHISEWKRLSDDVVGALSRAYDIGEWLSWSHEPRGHANATYLITAATGSYVLRKSESRKSLAGLRCETELIDFLRQKGYPAPEIIPARQGEKFLSHQGSFYLLTRLIPGGLYDPENPRHLLEAGGGLGLYHKLVKDFPGPFFQRLAPLLWHLGPEGSASFPAIEDFGRRYLGPGEQARLADMLSYTRQQAGFLYSQLAGIQPCLSPLMIQASYGQSALIFNNDTLVGVVDYDRATHDVRGLDLAYSLETFCHHHDKSGPEPRVVFDFERCRNFLRGYREVEPVPGEELQVMPLVFQARHIIKIGDKLNTFVAKDAVAERDERKFRKHVLLVLVGETAWLKWWAGHTRELLAAFHGD